jgi:hypothetical protein
VEAFHCELCGKDMTKWNAQQRQQHMERCLDKFTDNISQQLTQQGAVLPTHVCFIPSRTLKHFFFPLARL